MDAGERPPKQAACRGAETAGAAPGSGRASDKPWGAHRLAGEKGKSVDTGR